MNQLFNLIGKRWYLLATLITAFIYFRVAPLQVDPHHDGIILAAAVAVADGHPILSGAFSQYGPLPALIQGLFLWLFNTQLLTLRILTAFQCLAIGFAIYLLAKELTSQHLSRLTSFLWLLTSCIWVTQFPGSLLPWPSLISTLLVMYAMIFLIKSSITTNPYWAVLAGTFFGFAGFCRIQAFVLLPLIFLVGVFKFRQQLNTLLFSLIGYLCSWVVMAGYLLKTGGIDDFMQQVIITPLFTYSSLGQGNNYNRFQFALYLIETIGFVVLYIIVSFAIRKFHNKKILVAILTALIFGISYFGSWIATTTIPIKFRVLFGEPLQNFVVSPFYFTVTCSAILVVMIFLRNRKNKPPGFNFAEAVVILTAFGTLPQLYPQPDVMHLWWVAPIFICCVPVMLGAFGSRFTGNPLKILETIFISCIIFGVFAAVQFIERPWSEYKLGVLRGTYAHEEKARGLDIFARIEKDAVIGETSFDCPDGVYAVSGGTYLSADQWFVNWGFSDNDQPDIGLRRVICDKSRDFAISESKRLGMSLIHYRSNDVNKSIAILSKQGVSK
jgi:hypothetical protein